MMIPVVVRDLVMTNVGFAVILKGDTDPRSLPIFIGVPEAQAISIELAGETPPRPLTHDLMRAFLERMGVRLVTVEIHDLREGTFYARLRLQSAEAPFELDARPSDGIALALRTGASLQVARSVMEEAGKIIEAEETETTASGESSGRSPVSSTARILAVRKNALAKAIEEERYEDAARLRDEIKRLENPQEPGRS